MNEKAAELGLESTHYADPSGLLSDNVSSALDMARLITHASSDERIASIMRTSEYTVAQPGAHDHLPQHESSAAAATTSTCARGRPVSSRRRATASRRCCGCRRAVSRSRSSCLARARTRAASWSRAICSTGCRRRPRRSSPRNARRTAAPAVARESSVQRSRPSEQRPLIRVRPRARLNAPTYPQPTRVALSPT